MLGQRDFLEDIGEQFEALTGGYSGLEDGARRTAPLQVLTLTCELDDEILRIRAWGLFRHSPASASAIALQIGCLFNREPRDHAPRRVYLPDQNLEDLERLALARVRRRGLHVIRLPE